MRIGIDVMGGDHAPGAILDGALGALPRLSSGDQLVLVGDEQIICDALNQAGVQAGEQVEIAGATEVIDMAEPPVEAVRNKPDSSITVLGRMASRKAENPLDITISAGNTGAHVTAAQMYMRRLPGVHRPGIAVTIPTFSGPVVWIDVGANIEPKPHHLAQYGVMGDCYARMMLGIKSPRVGLMNVGGEEQKGTEEMKQARDLLRQERDLNFIGYVEGRGVFDGQADVVITDGVVGNVMVKLTEGLSEGIFKAIMREIGRNDKDLAERFKPVIKQIYADHDYHEYGGAPLLGVNGVCIISHGSSVARTMTNAILRARQIVDLGVNDTIVERFRESVTKDQAA